MTINQPCAFPAQQFGPTRWTYVDGVSSDDPKTAKESLDKVCEHYLKPSYAYLRGAGHAPAAAADFVQQFFENRVVNKAIFKGICKERGSFAAWFKTCLRNFVVDQVKHGATQRLGGGAPHIPVEVAEAEARLQSQSLLGGSPEDCFDRMEISLLMEKTSARVRQRYVARGETKLINVIQGHVPGAPSSMSYEEAANALGIGVNRVRTEVSKLRRQWVEAFLAEVAPMVRDVAEARKILQQLVLKL